MLKAARTAGKVRFLPVEVARAKLPYEIRKQDTPDRTKETKTPQPESGGDET
jgi:hypothetical protein